MRAAKEQTADCDRREKKGERKKKEKSKTTKKRWKKKKWSWLSLAV